MKLGYIKKNFFWSQWSRALRLGSPTGWILLALPGFWGYVWSCPQGKLTTLLWILAGAIWARSLGCFYNDWVDRDLDAQVKRTKTRPFVSHAPSRAMLSATGLLLAIGAGIFIYYLPIFCIILALVGGLGTIIYPWAKRWTDYPQIILGLIFNLALFMPLGIENCPLVSGLWLLYGYGFLWTISYDTVYAFQDWADDTRIGIKSLAVKMGPEKGWWILGGLILLRFGLLAILAGYAGNAGFGGKKAGLMHGVFWMVMVGVQLWQWWHWDLKNSKFCGVYFKKSPQEGYALTLWLLIF